MLFYTSERIRPCSEITFKIKTWKTKTDAGLFFERETFALVKCLDCILILK